MIIVILVALAIVSFVISYNEKQELIAYLDNIPEDMSELGLKASIARSSGVAFLFDFWWGASGKDLAVIAVIVLLIWAGIFLSPAILDQKQSGFGGMIVTRKGYGGYLLSVFSAQSVYIFSVVAVSTLLQAALAFAMGGFPTTEISINLHSLSALGVAFVIILQTFIIALYVILANGITLMLSAFIKNRYLVRALPLLALGLIPTVAGAAVTAVWKSFRQVRNGFSPLMLTYKIREVFIADFASRNIFIEALPFLCYFALLAALYLLNVQANKKSYL